MEKVTKKDLYARILEVMADDAEVVEMCEKEIERLNRPRKPVVNEAAIQFAESVYNVMVGLGGELTNKEICAEVVKETGETVSPQKVAAAVRRLVNDGRVEKIEQEKKKAPFKYIVA